MRFVDLLAASLVGALVCLGSLLQGFSTNESRLHANEPEKAIVEAVSCGNPACTCKNCDGKACKCRNLVQPQADEASRPIIYFFTMGVGCDGCVKMLPTYESLKADGHDIRKMNITDPRWERFADYYNIRQVPQFVTVNQKGFEIRRTEPGIVSKSQILGLGKSVLTEPVQAVAMDKVGFSDGSCSSCQASPRRSVRWRR